MKYRILLIPTFIGILFFSFSCDSGDNDLDEHYAQGFASLILGKDWYVVGLHCDDGSAPGNFDYDPFLQFGEERDSEHYLLGVEVKLRTQTPVGSWLDSNDVGELKLILMLSNYSTIEFLIFEITEDKMVLMDEKQQVFDSEDFCIITLEPR